MPVDFGFFTDKRKKPARWAVTREKVDSKWGWFFDGLKVNLPMWDRAGDTRDLTLFGNDSTLDGAVTWTTSAAGAGLNFTGASPDGGTIGVNGIGATGTVLTFAVLATRFTDTGAQYAMSHFNSGNRFYILARDGDYVFRIGAGSELGGTVPWPLNVPSLVYFVEDEGAWRAYADGVEIHSGSGTQGTFGGAGTLQLGNVVNSDHWTGIIHAAWVWRKAITAAQIRQHSDDWFGPFRMVDGITNVIVPSVAAGNPLASSLMMLGVGF